MVVCLCGHRHVQRVESAATAALFSALDKHLKARSMTLAQLVAEFDPHRLVSGTVPLLNALHFVKPTPHIPLFLPHAPHSSPPPTCQAPDAYVVLCLPFCPASIRRVHTHTHTLTQLDGWTCHASNSAVRCALLCPFLQGTLDLVGVSQLVYALSPEVGATPGSGHYFMALFDLDGDGRVGWTWHHFVAWPCQPCLGCLQPLGAARQPLCCPPQCFFLVAANSVKQSMPAST